MSGSGPANLKCWSLSLVRFPSLLSYSQLDQLPQLVIGVQSLDPAVQLDTTTAFRKILSIGESTPYKRLIASTCFSYVMFVPLSAALCSMPPPDVKNVPVVGTAVNPAECCR